MSPIYLSRSTYRLYFCIHLLIWLNAVITTFSVSDNPGRLASALGTRKSVKSSGCNHFENMTENVHVCFEVHIEKN